MKVSRPITLLGNIARKFPLYHARRESDAFRQAKQGVELTGMHVTL